MNLDALIHPDTLLIFAAVACSFLLGCVHRLVRELGQQRREVHHTDSDLRELLDRCDQQQARFERIQDEMKGMKYLLRSRAGSGPEPRSSDVNPRRLARAGAGVEAIMSTCNLSRSEAELVISVHGGGKPRAA